MHHYDLNIPVKPTKKLSTKFIIITSSIYLYMYVVLKTTYINYKMPPYDVNIPVYPATGNIYKFDITI